MIFLAKFSVRGFIKATVIACKVLDYIVFILLPHMIVCKNLGMSASLQEYQSTLVHLLLHLIERNERVAVLLLAKVVKSAHFDVAEVL